MDVTLENQNAEPESPIPDEELCFNPSDPDSMDKLLSAYGPEALYEIGVHLQKIAIDDTVAAIMEVNR